MNWVEYESIRADIVNKIRCGQPINHVQQIIGKIHSEVFDHTLYYPSCSTRILEMFLEIDKVYINR